MNCTVIATLSMLLLQSLAAMDEIDTPEWACSPLYYIMITLGNYNVAVEQMKQGARPWNDKEAKKIMYTIIYHDFNVNAEYVNDIFTKNKDLINQDSWPYGNCTMYANLLNNKAASVLCERILYEDKFSSFKDFFDISFIYI